MGPGFGGINIGGFALPNLNMDEINAGIASQVAKYLAEQELANATNEYEKDAAETKVEQVNEYEAGLGSLPPVVEQVMEELQNQPTYDTPPTEADYTVIPTDTANQPSGDVAKTNKQIFQDRLKYGDEREDTGATLSGPTLEDDSPINPNPPSEDFNPNTGYVGKTADEYAEFLSKLGSSVSDSVVGSTFPTGDTTTTTTVADTTTTAGDMEAEPSAEDILREIIASGEGIASGYEGDGYEDFLTEAPTDGIEEVIEQVMETTTNNDYYNPNYFGFEDERLIGKDNELGAQGEVDEDYLNKLLEEIAQTEASNNTYTDTTETQVGDAKEDTFGEYTDIQTMTDETTETGAGETTEETTEEAADFNPYNNPYFPFFYPAYDPRVYGQMDPSQTTGSEAVFDPGSYTVNPETTNLINLQREQYNQALQKAAYQAPDTVQEDYTRPMSAAEFGSVPGRYIPPEGARPYVHNREQPYDTDLGFIAMNRGGALNNRMGLGGLPPMQQNDKLTQLFAQSFRPRR